MQIAHQSKLIKLAGQTIIKNNIYSTVLYCSVLYISRWYIYRREIFNSVDYATQHNRLFVFSSHWVQWGSCLIWFEHAYQQVLNYLDVGKSILDFSIFSSCYVFFLHSRYFFHSHHFLSRVFFLLSLWFFFEMPTVFYASYGISPF